MKRTTAISLLFLLLASQFGHHVLYSLQDWNIREEQEQKILGNIPDAFLEKFEETPDLSWEDPGKEFLYHGRMYDVVRSRTEHGKTVHYAILDDKENELIKAFSKIQRSDPNAPQTPQSSKTIAKLQIPVFTLPEPALMLKQASAMPEYGNAVADRTITRPRSVLPCPPWA